MRKHKFSDEINRELKALEKSKLFNGLYGLIYDYIVIAISICATVKISFFLYPIAILLIGSRQRALATLLHDAAHLRLSSNKFINNFIGKYLTGFLIFQDFESYKKSHVINHHLYLGDENKDPDYQYHIQNQLYTKSTLKSFIFKILVGPLLLLKTFSFIKYLVINRFLTNGFSIKTLVFILSWAIILADADYLGLFKMLILFWFIPLIFIFPIIGWFIELSEHYPLVATSDSNIESSYNRDSHWLEGFFLGIHGESYHLVHHLRPGIPYWNVSKAHKIMLKDSLYAKINQDNGGIFLSRGNNKPIILKILANRSDFVVN